MEKISTDLPKISFDWSELQVSDGCHDLPHAI